MKSRRQFKMCLAIGLFVCAGPIVACGDDPDSPRASRGFDSTRVVAVETLTCANRVVRGAAIRLVDGIYLTAAHNVEDARSIEIDGQPMSYISTDERVDLGLLITDDSVDLSLVDVSDWTTSQAARSAAIVTHESVRETTISPDVLVRATRPDGSQRQWLGTPVLSIVVSGESGSALVQDGSPIGMIVQAVKNEERAFAVSAAEVREFVAKVTSVSGLSDSQYPGRLTSDRGTGPVHPVGSTCP